jgi:hypothetical protein
MTFCEIASSLQPALHYNPATPAGKLLRFVPVFPFFSACFLQRQFYRCHFYNMLGPQILDRAVGILRSANGAAKFFDIPEKNK